MNDRKARIEQMVICIALVVMIWVIYGIGVNKLNKRIEPCADDFSWVYQVDLAEIRDDEFCLQGFAFQVGIDAVGNNYEIILQELETGERFFFEMDYSNRKDVNDYFLCEYDYLQSGFEARIKEQKLDLQEKDYEVLLRILGGRKAIKTGIYLAGGQLVYANPNEFVPPNVENTEVDMLVKDGVLRLWEPEVGVYVYQYNGEFYWIIDEKYEFDEKGDMYIYFVQDTTQWEKISDNQIGERLYWDDKSFWLKQNELLELDTGRYRVGEGQMSGEYSVEKIWTGECKEDWIWKRYFRPYYEFD